MPPQSTSRVPAERRQAPSQTVERARARQEETEATAAATGTRLAGYDDWFTALLPKHLPVEAFRTLLYGVIRKDHDLAVACERNFQSLLVAATDCAQLGGIPGKDYHLIAFNDTTTGIPTVTGIVDYKLEVQLAYRSFQVDTVVAECVYLGDDFAWAPTRMRLPDHEIKNTQRANKDLVAVYAWAEYQGRRVGKCVVMWRDEVMKHKAVAKSKKFWDGPWEPDMWRKTAVHVGRRWWPQSPAYQTEVLAVQARALGMGGIMAQLDPDSPPVLVPPKDPPRRPAVNGRQGEPAGDTLRTVTAGHDTGHGPGDQDEDPAWAGLAASKERPGNGNGGQQDSPGPGGEDEDLDGPVSDSTMGQLSRMFQTTGWSGTVGNSRGITKDHRRIVACLLAARNSDRQYRKVESVKEMTEREARHALRQAGEMRAAARDGQALADQFQRIYDAAMKAIQAKNGGNGGNGGGEAGA